MWTLRISDTSDTVQWTINYKDILSWQVWRRTLWGNDVHIDAASFLWDHDSFESVIVQLFNIKTIWSIHIHTPKCNHIVNNALDNIYHTIHSTQAYHAHARDIIKQINDLEDYRDDFFKQVDDRYVIDYIQRAQHIYSEESCIIDADYPDTHERSDDMLVSYTLPVTAETLPDDEIQHMYDDHICAAYRELDDWRGRIKLSHITSQQYGDTIYHMLVEVDDPGDLYYKTSQELYRLFEKCMTTYENATKHIDVYKEKLYIEEY